MGLMDRDYMHERNRQRPFSPPPERFGTLSKILVFVAVLFLLYLAADWKLNQRAPRKADNLFPAKSETLEPPSTTSTPSLQSSKRDTGRYDPAQDKESTRTVSKCVVNGKTSYSDTGCAHGSVASQVTTRADHNLMEPVRPQASTGQEATTVHETVVTQSTASADGNKSECGFIDQQIKNLDAMARQPQSGQMQDWITTERKKLRDRQFRIPCR